MENNEVSLLYCKYKQKKVVFSQSTQALRLGIHGHIISGMSKAWVHSNKWLKIVLTLSPRIEKSINLWLLGSWMLYAIKNNFILFLHSFSKQQLLVLVGMRIPGWCASYLSFYLQRWPLPVSTWEIWNKWRKVDAYVSPVAGQSVLEQHHVLC